MIRGWHGVAALVVVAACGSPPPPSTLANASTAAAPPTGIAKVAMFGDVAIADGEFAIMDRGSGDGRVHVITVSRDDRATKASWDDHPGLSTIATRSELRTAPVALSEEERVAIHAWADELWRLAPLGRRSYQRPPPDEHSSYEWAVVLRRGDEVRVIEGGANHAPDSQPDMLEGVVDFLDMHF